MNLTPKERSLAGQDKSGREERQPERRHDIPQYCLNHANNSRSQLQGV